MYIAVDIGVKSHEESKTSVVDVFELSKNLRRDRHGIVSSLEHYNFIYQVREIFFVIPLDGYYTVHSPLFFRNFVEIERFALRAAILHECQNYLGDGGGLGGFSLPPPPPQL